MTTIAQHTQSTKKSGGIVRVARSASKQTNKQTKNLFHFHHLRSRKSTFSWASTVTSNHRRRANRHDHQYRSRTRRMAPSFSTNRNFSSCCDSSCYRLILHLITLSKSISYLQNPAFFKCVILPSLSIIIHPLKLTPRYLTQRAEVRNECSVEGVLNKSKVVAYRLVVLYGTR
ncbi:unnamed protein product [Amoebophrya sp. A25]|nr:unnamed protein product [Amoebophrya sp. A25]|eukprot:GSA25T00003412001.1